MNSLNKWERKLGRFAIPNIMRYMVAIYAIGYLITMLSPNVFYILMLDFDKILQGQVWRLVTFVIPYLGSTNILFVLIAGYFYYMIGNTLERTWGAFRLNLYIFSGILFNLLAYLIIYLITGYSMPGITVLPTVLGTLFFAFAALYPDMQFLMYFIIPIKAKYLAWFQGAFYLYDIIQSVIHSNYLSLFTIVASLANFIIFYFASRNYKRISPSEFNRKAQFRRKMQSAKREGHTTQHNGQTVITRHKCAVCGRTELDDDQLEFRFCSKCDGNYEYCMDHLFSHEHVKR